MMRQSVAALAVIRQPSAAGTLWLAQWNHNWQAFNFVGGHKRTGETFRDCVAREVSEELELESGRDVCVAESPLAHLEYVAWSDNAQAETAYTTELFDVSMLTDAARRKINADGHNRWLSETEIRERMCSNGQSVSATMPFLMTKAELWTPTTNDSPEIQPHLKGPR